MKNLDLNAYGVSEMSRQEMVETDGGGFLLGLLVVAVIAVVATGCSVDNSKTVNVNVQVNNDSTSNQQQGGGAGR